MFKKFNYNLNHSRVGAIWGISLIMILLGFLVQFMPGEFIIPKSQMIIFLLGYGLIFNFIIATYTLIKGDFKQPLNVTYVCPTARKYLSEQEIKEYETSVEDEIKKDIEFGKEMVKAYKEI